MMRRHWTTGGGLAFALMAALCCLFAASARAALPAPAWQISQVPNPTNFTPGTSSPNVGLAPQYEALVTNIGGKASKGTTFTEVLSEGLVAEGEPEFAIRIGAPLNEAGTCAVSGSGHIVTCVINATIFAGASFNVTVPLGVTSSAEGDVTSETTVVGGGAVGTARTTTAVTGVQEPFSLRRGPGFSAGAFGEAGETSVAGAHPFLTKFSVGVNTVAPAQRLGNFEASEDLRRIGVELPQGMVVNPTATEVRCPMQVLNTQTSTNPNVFCPPASQVGQAFVSIFGIEHGVGPIYNMVPPPGVPAALGFSVAGLLVEIQGGLGEDFHLTAASSELLKRFRVYEASVVLWGVPSDHRHDPLRSGGESGAPGGCIETGGCSIGTSPKPFVTMPTSCSEPLALSATAVSWFGTEVGATAPLTDREFNDAHITGCDELAFEPTIESRATTNAAESPAGLDFRVHQTQDESLEGRSTAALKDATVTLPEGMTLNPSAAGGLGSCSEEQMGYRAGGGGIRFATTPQSCPDASKVGSIEVVTPLLEHPLPGAVYLAKPFDNPFGSLLAIYLAVEDEESGIVAKLAGKVEPDPVTGQLKATFTENPELPIEEFKLRFFSGARGTLTTPLTCGAKTTTSTLTPWSTPEGAAAHPSDSFQTTAGCQTSEAAAPKTFEFTAGTVSPLSGTYSPFVLRLSRPDGSQHITGIDTTLPEGLLGKLAGVSYCPESGIAQAISREQPEMGKLEQQGPSCPASSEVGTVKVTAGSGVSPIAVSGHAYLAGPYKGAPLSLIVVVPAVSGPFDLGTVVDRVALNVGEYDARIHAVADPLPTIRDGIPLDVRSVELTLDHPSFTLNPTSCEAMAIEGTASTQAGQNAPLRNRFQVGECGRLGFKPKLAISLKGATKRAGHPALKAVVTYPKKGEYANIARAQVNLPHSEFLDQGNIGKACTKVLIAQRACPAKSIYGKAKAWTPLLDRPLEGPVYLVGGYGYKLPALVAELNGQIRVLLVGKVDTGANKGIRNTFEAVPDAPVEKFVLEMKGGKKYGLLENSENICHKTQKAGATFSAQNARTVNLSVKIANSCRKSRK